MDSERSPNKRMDVEEVDKISSLPDDLILKILSFIGIKDTIGTGTLSSRWRYIWTSMSCLRFSSEDFSTLPKFSKFVTQFLSRRNNQVEVSSLDLNICGKVTQPFLKEVLDYAYSHNIQQLNVSFTFQNFSEFPLSLPFSSQSLKRLGIYLNVDFEYDYDIEKLLIKALTLELPALTTLYLYGLTNENYTALLSKCPNLKDLTLDSYQTPGADFSIFHPQLSNLTLKNGPCMDDVDVVAPQLQNLIIKDFFHTKYVISAPNLTSLVYNCGEMFQLSTDGFHSLKEAHICVPVPLQEDAHQIVPMFQQLHNVKFLKLNLEIVELLLSQEELISHQRSPFANLKSLTIYPTCLYREEKASMAIEVKNYFLDSSPGVSITMVSREEVRAKEDSQQAKNYMRDLRVLLDEEKANRGADEMTHQLQQIEGRNVNGCWKDLSSEIKQGRKKTTHIISKLKKISELLKTLPTSMKEKLQTCFSSLCAEADTVVKKILDDIKILCEMKERFFSVYILELAQTSQSSS